MAKKTLIICLLLIASAVSKLIAQGQSQTQVTYGAGLGQRTVSLSTGTPVPNGNAVWIGTFAPGFNATSITANQNNPATLLANWNNYGSTAINTLPPPFNQAGSFSGSSTKSDSTFDSQRIYLWIFETDNATAPLPDFSNVNEYAIYSSSLNNWVFPVLGSIPPGDSQSVNSSQVNQWFHGNVDSSHLTLGSFNPVPEPSTIGLLGLAIPAAVLALRKGRSRR